MTEARHPKRQTPSAVRGPAGTSDSDPIREWLLRLVGVVHGAGEILVQYNARAAEWRAMRGILTDSDDIAARIVDYNRRPNLEGGHQYVEPPLPPTPPPAPRRP